jgi:prepilin-type N-terminal cleavage/methylation domain-containing protein
MKDKKNPNSRAFSIIELLTVLVVFGVVLLLALSVEARTSAKSVRINCLNNLRQVALAFRIWEGGNGNHFPQYYAGSTTYPAINSANGVGPGGSWPIVSTGSLSSGAACPNMYTVFEVMSNELNTPKIMVCPADERVAATNFTTDFFINGPKNTRCSYFVGENAAESNPQMFLAGDRNMTSDTTVLVVGTPPTGTYSQFGIVAPTASQGYTVSVGTNFVTAGYLNFGWNAKIHISVGNVALADGSVQLLSSSSLKLALSRTGDPRSANVLLFP